MPSVDEAKSTAVRIDGLETLQAIAFDVDGVLTDGKLTWGPSGEEAKTFAFSDIMGVSLARRLGIRMALISGESTSHVDRYAEKLKIPHVVKGCRDKATALREFAERFSVPLQHTCFFGDDVNDLFAMEIAGVCACPKNAAEEVLEFVCGRGFVATQHGGHGAVREFVDALLKARGLRGRDVFQWRPPE